MDDLVRAEEPDVSLLIRLSRALRRTSSRPPRVRFEDLSREDQVAFMDNVRGGSGFTGARESAKFAGPIPGVDVLGPGTP